MQREIYGKNARLLFTTLYLLLIIISHRKVTPYDSLGYFISGRCVIFRGQTREEPLTTTRALVRDVLPLTNNYTALKIRVARLT